MIETGWPNNCLISIRVGVRAALSRVFKKRDTDFEAQSWEGFSQEVLSLAIRSSGDSGFRRPSRLVNRKADCEQPRRIGSSGRGH